MTATTVAPSPPHLRDEGPRVVAIFTAPSAGAPMISVASVFAEAERGLQGDRYRDRRGTFSSNDRKGRQVTLIEMEAIEAVVRDCKLDLTPDQTRRNLVTRGVYLNHLVGRELQVGDVRLLGVRLCEPCDLLEERTGLAQLRKALLHRGGLSCDVLTDGTIRAGDPVRT